MTQKEPESAVHLEQAMIENARNDNADTRLKVYQELLFSNLLIALADTDTEASANTTDDQDVQGADASKKSNSQQLNIAILVNPKGTKFAAVFTSPEAIRRFRSSGGQFATMRGQDIFKLLEPSPAEVIVVNPGTSPIAVLPKLEYRQLASGIVPKSSVSPVQVPVNPQSSAQNTNSETQGADSENNQSQTTVQIGFPSNVFNDEQTQHAHDILLKNTNVVAAAIGVIQPPNAPDKNSWIRTVFLRMQDAESGQENLKNLCHSIQSEITQNNDLFASCHFEVGIMPDVKFWKSLHENKVVLFDKDSLILEPHELAS